MYLKIVRKDGSPLYQYGNKYRVGKTYISELDKSQNECTRGIYYIEPRHLLLWRCEILNNNNKIFVVKPLGDVVNVNKGARTDKLKIVRTLKKLELARLEKEQGIDIEKNIGIGNNLIGGDGSTLTGGNWSTLTGEDLSTLTGGDKSTLTGGNRSTLTGGDGSTLTGGNWSTLTGEDLSTLTGGGGSTLKVNGDTCWIVKQGKQCVLHQVWYDKGNKSVMLDLDKLLKKYKVGDKVKIVKGKISKEV